MQLLDLPLDCFRYMLCFVALDFNYHEHVYEFLSLRLINRLLDTEVLRTLSTPSFHVWYQKYRTLETTSFFGDRNDSYPDFLRRLPFTSSYPEFVASYLCVRPCLQTPWDATFSSILNHVVDALGFDADNELRKKVMRKLCCHVFEMHQWKQPRNWLWVLHHQTSEMRTDIESLEFNVLLADVLLCNRITLADQDVDALMKRKSSVFGTLLQACIKSGQVKLATSLLDTGVDINDETLKILETAIECENTEMLSLVCSPRYNLSNSLRTAHRLFRAMYQAIEGDRTEAACFLLNMSLGNSGSSADPENSSDSDDSSSGVDHSDWLPRASHNVEQSLATWIGFAAYRNNFDFVKRCLSDLEHDGFVGSVLVNSSLIPELLCFYGHKEMLNLFLTWGIKFDYEKMMLAAACGGSVSILRYLLHERGAICSEDLLLDIVLVAVHHATPRHAAFIEALFADSSLFEGQSVSPSSMFKSKSRDYSNLFWLACSLGNVFIVRKFAEAGMELDHLESPEHTSPVLVALKAGQSAVVAELVSRGAKPVDPMKTEFKEDFEKGVYPRPTERKAMQSINRITSRSKVVCENPSYQTEVILRYGMKDPSLGMREVTEGPPIISSVGT